MADTQTPPKDDALQQPTDAVPMSDMGKDDALPQSTDTGKEPAGQSTDGLTVAVPEPSVAAAAERSPKGKSKEEDKQREDSLSIGPSDPPAEAGEELLVCTITLLLPTGARHPFRIDEKYLSKRSVEVPEVTDSGRKDPFSISVYKLKELILRGWRDDWEGKPASPSSIRLIFFGKLLEDKEQLKKYQFSADSPNIVHMSVRPPDMMEEDEAAKGKASSRDGRSRESGGGCCVIL